MTPGELEFKFLKVGQLQKTGWKHHAVMKKCTSKVSWSLHLRLSLWVCSEDAKKVTTERKRSSKRYLSEALCQSRQSSNCCPGLCWSQMIIGQMVERMHKSLKKKKKGGKRAGLSTEANSIPHLAHSLNHDLYTWNKCSQCPEGLNYARFVSHGRVRRKAGLKWANIPRSWT